jgi:ribulose-5-phosphate 4-epimerase/fuculose-1-phosphate aldolase
MRDREARDPVGSPAGDAASSIVAAGAYLQAAGLAPAASGNLSARTTELLLTPTGARLGALDAAALARLDQAGARVAGSAPSKEAPLHLAIYRVRPDARAIVHLHAPDAVAVSCLADLDPADALPAYTAYRVMRIGRLPLVGYLPPGDPGLGDAAAAAAPRAGRGLLLANHGLVAWGTDMDEAVAVAEEIESAAGLHLRLAGRAVRLLTPAERAEVERRFG